MISLILSVPEFQSHFRNGDGGEHIGNKPETNATPPKREDAMKKIVTFTVFIIVFTLWLMVYTAHPAELKTVGSAAVITFEDNITTVFFSAEIANLTEDDGYVFFICEAIDRKGNVIETRGVDSGFAKVFLIKGNTTRNILVTFSFSNLLGKASEVTIRTRQVQAINT